MIQRRKWPTGRSRAAHRHECWYNRGPTPNGRRLEQRQGCGRLCLGNKSSASSGTQHRVGGPVVVEPQLARQVPHAHRALPAVRPEGPSTFRMLRRPVLADTRSSKPAHGCRLARAVGSQQAEDLAACHLQVHPAQGLNGTDVWSARGHDGRGLHYQDTVLVGVHGPVGHPGESEYKWNTFHYSPYRRDVIMEARS